VFIVGFEIFALRGIWLIPKLWRAIRAPFTRIAKLFGKGTKAPPLEGVKVTFGRESIEG
tara:strand:+ start:412 stop:588 length:177 start_codon:yes stop_codon:yes gene_type:complete